MIKVGGRAVKGTTFRFDCALEGVNVMVNESYQGTDSFNGLGTSLVDVHGEDKQSREQPFVLTVR